MPGLDVYRAALLASWHALLDAWPGADVVESDGWFASRCPDPVLTNGVLERADALPNLLTHLGAAGGTFAVWTWSNHTAAAAGEAGLVPTEQTVAMVLDLQGWTPRVPPATGFHGGADPALVAELNSLPPQTLLNAHPASGYVTDDHACGLLILGAGPDRNLSMVVTRADQRRRGLASGLITAALAELAAAGVRTVSLQATPAGQGVYARLGFEPVGTIQEWEAPRVG